MCVTKKQIVSVANKIQSYLDIETEFTLEFETFYTHSRIASVYIPIYLGNNKQFTIRVSNHKCRKNPIGRIDYEVYVKDIDAFKICSTVLDIKDKIETFKNTQ